MERLTTLAQDFIREILHPGDFVIDATAGNGWDTLFLAQRIFPHGKVYAFDIQHTALAQSLQLLKQHQLDQQVQLIHNSHVELMKFIPLEAHGQIAAVMMNLGYLPGGDKNVTTTAADSLKVIQLLNNLLKLHGRASIISYPGHAAGSLEAEVVHNYLNSMEFRLGFLVREIFPEGHKAPRLYMLEKVCKSSSTLCAD